MHELGIMKKTRNQALIDDLKILTPNVEISNVCEKKLILPDSTELLSNKKKKIVTSISYETSPEKSDNFRKIPSLENRYEINENGTIFRNIETGNELKIFLDMHHSSKGYYASLISFNGKTKRVMIHHLVAECWLGPRPKDYEVDHIDRNSRNNDYTNLRYVTHSEQMRNRVMSDKLIKIATSNCMKYVESICIPVQISRKGMDDVLTFRSFSECGRFLGNLYNENPANISRKLSDRIKQYKDFQILYPDKSLIRLDYLKEAS